MRRERRTHRWLWKERRYRKFVLGFIDYVDAHAVMRGYTNREAIGRRSNGVATLHTRQTVWRQTNVRRSAAVQDTKTDWEAVRARARTLDVLLACQLARGRGSIDVECAYGTT